MTIDEIRELIRVVHETGIAELELQRGENRVWIKAAAAAPIEATAPSGAYSAGLGSHPPPGSGPIPMRAEAGIIQPAPVEDEHHELVKSPIVGTYYDAPVPGAAPFVKVGDRVQPKQVLCIIESMKLMNEIEADGAGFIVAKHVESGRPVEYGELLFTIRPL